MNLSDLKAEDVELDQPAPMRLSDVHPDDITSEPSESPVTAATTGIANGSSFGLAGPLAGLGKTAMDAVTGTRGPLAGEPLSDLGKDYAESRDSFQNDANRASDAHPSISGAATTVGTLLPTAMGSVGNYIEGKLASRAAKPVIEKSESWARDGLSNTLGDEGRRAVAAEVAKKIAKRAAKAVLLGH